MQRNADADRVGSDRLAAGSMRLIGPGADTAVTLAGEVADMVMDMIDEGLRRGRQHRSVPPQDNDVTIDAHVENVQRHQFAALNLRRNQVKRDQAEKLP